MTFGLKRIKPHFEKVKEIAEEVTCSQTNVRSKVCTQFNNLFEPRLPSQKSS